MVRGDAPPTPAEQRPQAQMHVASDGYFETMGAKITSGRAFTPQDTVATEPVVIVNEEFVKRHYPDRTPVGEEILTWTAQVGPLGRNFMWFRHPDGVTRTQPRLRIIGVVSEHPERCARTARGARGVLSDAAIPVRRHHGGDRRARHGRRRDRAQERAEGRVAKHAGREDRNVGRPLSARAPPSRAC